MLKKVDAVVVTYNRLDLLKKCLQALLSQRYKLQNIFVIDNNSQDETLLFLRELSKKYPSIKPIHLSTNIGGAGGFYVGLKAFIEKSKSDYVWIMDDDAIPTSSALTKIMNKTNQIKKFGFLSSNVRWKDDSPAKMNIPQPTEDWNENITQGLVEVEYASFVAILFPREVILKVGLPIKEYFIWGDDVEYTKRITQAGLKGYMVIDSIVHHEIKQNIGTNIVTEKDKNRIKRYYFAKRNTFFTMKKRYNKKEFAKWIINVAFYEPIKILHSSPNKKILRIKTTYKGIFAGMIFHPHIYRFKDSKK